MESPVEEGVIKEQTAALRPALWLSTNNELTGRGHSETCQGRRTGTFMRHHGTYKIKAFCGTKQSPRWHFPDSDALFLESPVLLQHAAFKHITRDTANTTINMTIYSHLSGFCVNRSSAAMKTIKNHSMCTHILAIITQEGQISVFYIKVLVINVS